MNEAKRAGMKGLTRTNLKTIGHELAVGSRIDPPEDLVAAITGIVFLASLCSISIASLAS